MSERLSSVGVFPFGQPVDILQQQDRTQKRVFVLGVYASAVHAKWVRPSGEEAVKALAVASEPCIFWRGDGADEVIRQIAVPEALGRLMPADRQFNGPSGIALDERFLEPLGLSRNDAWLCDLVPHSCVNPQQQKAIDRAYTPVADEYGLATPTVPAVPRQLADDERRLAIVEEIRQSGADVLILLGDQPIRWFLAHLDPRRRKLSDFGRSCDDYGLLHKVQLDGHEVLVLPLAHPRQVARLGRSSASWYELHQGWINSRADGMLS